jgi:hypothetical protein
MSKGTVVCIVNTSVGATNSPAEAIVTSAKVTLREPASDNTPLTSMSSFVFKSEPANTVVPVATIKSTAIVVEPALMAEYEILLSFVLS